MAIRQYDGDLQISVADIEKNGMGVHEIYYEDFFDSDSRTLLLKDKSREYRVSHDHYEADTSINWSSQAESKVNHIAFIEAYDDDTYTTTVVSNGGYNQIYTYDHLDYTYANGHDVVNTGNLYDTYDAGYTKKTSLVIKDMGYGDNDTLVITSSQKDYNNMRVIFNVARDGEGFDGDMETLFIMDKSNVKASNFVLGNNGYSVKNGITVNRVENVSINSVNLYTDKEAWYNEVMGQVASWLNNHEGYDSTMDVFASGNSKDIASLLKVYQGISLDVQPGV